MNKITNTQKGSMLIDLIIALFLASIFVAVIANNTTTAKEIFEQSKIRLEHIDEYEKHQDLISNVKPSAVPALSTTTRISSQYYGNLLYKNSISFESATSSAIGFDIIIPQNTATEIPVNSTPFCAVNFVNSQTIGSYGRYLQGNKINSEDSLASLIPIIRKIHLPIDPNLNATSFLVKNNLAYITFDSAIQNDPDLIMMDLSSDEATIIDSINTGPGLSDLVLVGKYIFAVAPSTVGQLHIIMQSSQRRFSLIDRYKLPLPFATATPPLGSSLAYLNSQIFIGTEKWSGDELNILDIRDRENPTKVSGFEIDSKISSIYPIGHLVYITASNIHQLSLLDISNSSPILLTTFSPDGWQRQDGKAISLFEDKFKFGRTSGGFDIANEFEYFDFASSSTTTLASFVATNHRGGVYDIIQDQIFSYFISRETDNEFSIVRDEVDRSQISSSTNRIISFPIIPQKMTCNQDKIYILAKQSPFIYEISFDI